MFWESTGLVDNAPSDAPLCGNIKCAEQGVPGQRARCSSSVRLDVRYEANLVLNNISVSERHTFYTLCAFALVKYLSHEQIAGAMLSR
jgi:hypothetical protein